MSLKDRILAKVEAGNAALFTAFLDSTGTLAAGQSRECKLITNGSGIGSGVLILAAGFYGDGANCVWQMSRSGSTTTGFTDVSTTQVENFTDGFTVSDAPDLWHRDAAIGGVLPGSQFSGAMEKDFSDFPLVIMAAHGFPALSFGVGNRNAGAVDVGMWVRGVAFDEDA